MSSALREFAAAFARTFARTFLLGSGLLVAAISIVLGGTAVILGPTLLGIYAKYGEVAAVYEMKVLGDTWGPIVGVINAVWILSIFAATIAWIQVVENHRKESWESAWDVTKRLVRGDSE